MDSFLGDCRPQSSGVHRSGATSGLVVVSFAVLFQLTLFSMPGLFTTDIFGYLAYAQVGALYGGNPYLSAPSHLVENRLVSWHAAFDSAMSTTPSVYGPLWTDLGWVLVKAGGELSLVDQVLAYKVLMNGLHLVNLGLVWWLLGRVAPGADRGAERLTAFTLFAWNPLVLFEGAGNGHNDVLMALLLLLGLVPLVVRRVPLGVTDPLSQPQVRGSGWTANGRWLAAVALVGLSALVKYTTAVVGLACAVAWAAQFRSGTARLVWLGGAGLLVLGIAGGLFLPWLATSNVLGPVLSFVDGGATPFYVFHLPGLLADRLGPAGLGALGFDRETARATAQAVTRISTRLLFLTYLGWELHRLWSASRVGGDAAVRAMIGTSARILLALLLLVIPRLHPWYFIAPLALVTLHGWRYALTRVVVAYSLLSLPAYYALFYYDWGHAQFAARYGAYPELAAPVRAALVLGLVVLPLLIPFLCASLARQRSPSPGLAPTG